MKRWKVPGNNPLNEIKLYWKTFVHLRLNSFTLYSLWLAKSCFTQGLLKQGASLMMKSGPLPGPFLALFFVGWIISWCLWSFSALSSINLLMHFSLTLKTVGAPSSCSVSGVPCWHLCCSFARFIGSIHLWCFLLSCCVGGEGRRKRLATHRGSTTSNVSYWSETSCPRASMWCPWCFSLLLLFTSLQAFSTPEHALRNYQYTDIF